MREAGSGARSYVGGDVNVFGIQTGVAIVWLVSTGVSRAELTVRYRRRFGKKADKLAALADPFDAAAFEEVAGADLFVPVRWPTRSRIGALPVRSVPVRAVHKLVSSRRGTRARTPRGR